MYKNLFIILVAAFLFTGCSTYRAGQTPDDVYYSPDQKDNSSLNYVNMDDNNYLRMKVQNYGRWGTLDDFDYWYDSRYYGTHFYVFNNPYSSWGFYPYSYGHSSYWFTFGYNPWSFYPWGYYPWGFYSPYASVVYYKNRNYYYGNILNGNMRSYQNNTYSNANYLNQGNTGKKGFGSLFKSNFSSREQNNNPYIYSDKRNTPVRVFESSKPMPNMNTGSRSGGFKSTGSNTGSRPPKSN